MTTSQGQIQCPFCAEQIHPQAAVCKHCGVALPQGMERAVFIGRRYNLGQLPGGGYGVWDSIGAAGPMFTYPETEDGWASANVFYNNAEHEHARALAKADATNHAKTYGGLTTVLVVLALVYYFYHQQHYADCLIKPGLFEWPDRCI